MKEKRTIEADISLVLESGPEDGITSIYVKAGSVAEETFRDFYANSDHYTVAVE